MTIPVLSSNLWGKWNAAENLQEIFETLTLAPPCSVFTAFHTGNEMHYAVTWWNSSFKKYYELYELRESKKVYPLWEDNSCVVVSYRLSKVCTHFIYSSLLGLHHCWEHNGPLPLTALRHTQELQTKVECVGTGLGWTYKYCWQTSTAWQSGHTRQNRASQQTLQSICVKYAWNPHRPREPTGWTWQSILATNIQKL